MFSAWNLHPWLEAVSLKHKRVSSESMKLGGKFSRAMRHSGRDGHVAGLEAPSQDPKYCKNHRSIPTTPSAPVEQPTKIPWIELSGQHSRVMDQHTKSQYEVVATTAILKRIPLRFEAPSTCQNQTTKNKTFFTTDPPIQLMVF